MKEWMSGESIFKKCAWDKAVSKRHVWRTPFPSFTYICTTKWQHEVSKKDHNSALAQDTGYITTVEFRRSIFPWDLKLAVQCLDQTTGVQKRKYRHRARQTDRQCCRMNNLASLDACPQAGSLLKASRVFWVETAPKWPSNCVNKVMQQRIGSVLAAVWVSRLITNPPNAASLSVRFVLWNCGAALSDVMALPNVHTLINLFRV